MIDYLILHTHTHTKYVYDDGANISEVFKFPFLHHKFDYFSS